MFHLDLASKRSKLALRFFTYGVMTLATIIFTTIAVFYALGYRFDQNDLTFEQGGLLQMRSTPGGADVYIDSELQSSDTPLRANLIAGRHTAELQLSGYTDWRKDFYLAAGQVLWLDYAMLLPTTITTSEAAVLPSAVNSLASPDHKMLFIQASENQPNFMLADFSKTSSPVVEDFAVPESALTKINDTYGVFEIVEWALNSKHLLIKHTNGDIIEFIRLNVEDQEGAINISNTFGLKLLEVHFAGSNPDEFYANNNGVLRSLDIDAGSASAALVNNLEKFVLYDDDIIAYVSLQDLDGGGTNIQKAVGIYSEGQAMDIQVYPSDTNLLIDYTEFMNHAYLAINSGGSGTTILRDPTATNKDSSEFAILNLLSSPSVDWIDFNSNGRILAVGKGNEFASYDLDLDTAANWTLSGAEVIKPLRWLDNFHLWTDAGGILKIFEYDGGNERDITSVAEVNSADLSTDGDYLYSIGIKTTGEYQLQSSKLVND